MIDLMILVTTLVVGVGLGGVVGLLMGHDQRMRLQEALEYERGLTERYEQEQRDARLLEFVPTTRPDGYVQRHVHGDCMVTVYQVGDSGYEGA